MSTVIWAHPASSTLELSPTGEAVAISHPATLFPHHGIPQPPQGPSPQALQVHTLPLRASGPAPWNRLLRGLCQHTHPCSGWNRGSIGAPPRRRHPRRRRRADRRHRLRGDDHKTAWRVLQLPGRTALHIGSVLRSPRRGVQPLHLSGRAPRHRIRLPPHPARRRSHDGARSDPRKPRHSRQRPPPAADDCDPSQVGRRCAR